MDLFRNFSFGTSHGIGSLFSRLLDRSSFRNWFPQSIQGDVYRAQNRILAGQNSPVSGIFAPIDAGLNAVGRVLQGIANIPGQILRGIATPQNQQVIRDGAQQIVQHVGPQLETATGDLDRLAERLTGQTNELITRATEGGIHRNVTPTHHFETARQQNPTAHQTASIEIGEPAGLTGPTRVNRLDKGFDGGPTR